MSKKCAVCGVVRSITIKCGLCGKNICLVDIDAKTGLCADCQTIVYVETYKHVIENYETA